MNILFIAYYFPPSLSSGSFRPFYFARHLMESGQNITVLTVKPEHYLPDQALDYDLLTERDKQITVERTPVFRPRELLIRLKKLFASSTVSQKKSATPEGSTKIKNNKTFFQGLKDTVTDLLATPDQHIGWLPYAVLKGRKVIKHKQIDVLFATASPWSSLLIGVFLKALTKKPLVMDFRDPWVANPGFFKRGRLGRWIDRKLERVVLKHADSIVANTENLRKDFLQRYSFLQPEQVQTIPNGFEVYHNFGSATGQPVFTITHTGSLYFSRSPEQLLQALQNCIRKEKIDSNQVRLQLIGGMNTENNRIKELVQSPELSPVLQIKPRVPYSQAQEYMKSSTVLLIIQPDFPLQIPRKVYDYMAMRKPMFCLAEEHSATWNLVRDQALGFVCQNTCQDIEATLEHMYHKWQDGSLAPLHGEQCDQYLNKNLTSRLQAIFSSLVPEQENQRMSK